MKASRLQVIECLSYFEENGTLGKYKELFDALHDRMLHLPPESNKYRKMAALYLYEAILNNKFISSLKEGNTPPDYWTKEVPLEDIINGVF